MTAAIVRAVLGFELLLTVAAAAVAQPSGPGGNLPIPPREVERHLRDEPFEITAVSSTKGGIMATAKWTLAFRDGQSLDAKWKAAPSGGDGWNNSPRREVAAYQVQQLFLDPDEYIVPPIAARCVSFDVYRAFDKHPAANLPHGQCVFGALSAWLRNVEKPDATLQPERFSRDNWYAYEFGKLNVLTYVITHRDAKGSNFLMSTDPHNPQIFAVDNGIAFGGELYNFFTWHFDNIVVGGLPRQTIERLRRVRPEDLAHLGVVAELRAGADGVLRSVPPSANVDPNAGVRLLPDGIQLGLTAEEIDLVASRRQELLERVDRGEIPTFGTPPPLR
jgi:hypothetical protein